MNQVSNSNRSEFHHNQHLKKKEAAINQMCQQSAWKLNKEKTKFRDTEWSLHAAPVGLHLPQHMPAHKFPPFLLSEQLKMPVQRKIIHDLCWCPERNPGDGCWYKKHAGSYRELVFLCSGGLGRLGVPRELFIFHLLYDPTCFCLCKEWGCWDVSLLIWSKGLGFNSFVVLEGVWDLKCLYSSTQDLLYKWMVF